MDRCEECGFEYNLDEALTAAPRIVQGTNDLASLLNANGADITIRQDPGTWSPLEYGCHVRDVLLVQRERVLTARWVQRPSFHPMGRDERDEYDGYAEQHVADVARQLGDAARLFANVISRLSPEDWERTVIYNYPQRTERSLRWVAVHTMHEVSHHTLDVRHQLAGTK
jgi:hypothetical protein